MGFMRNCNSIVRFSTISKNLLGFQSGLATPNSSKMYAVSKNLLGFQSSSPTPYRFTSSTTLPPVKISYGTNNLLMFGFDKKLNNPLGHFVGTRNYCVDRNHKFTTAPSINYLSNLTRFFGKFESVPYTKKTLVVFPFFDRVLGVDDFREEVLPDTHPHCVRVRAIARKLLKALQREDGKHHTLSGEQWPIEEDSEGKLDKETMESGNLDGRNWEIVVWDRPEVHAWYTNTGKLLVASNLCDFYKTDAEVAFSIAHLIGHVVAHHLLREYMFNSIPFMLYYLVKYGKTPWPDYTLRHEQEADYIGMFLSASAGYDPRVAPVVLRDKTGDGSPCSFMEKRISLLSQPKVMQEAVSIYQESIKGQGTE